VKIKKTDDKVNFKRERSCPPFFDLMFYFFYMLVPTMPKIYVFQTIYADCGQSVRFIILDKFFFSLQVNFEDKNSILIACTDTRVAVREEEVIGSS
jgi:hypothetical protein